MMKNRKLMNNLIDGADGQTKKDPKKIKPLMKKMNLEIQVPDDGYE